MKVGFVLSAGL